jgi:hypothetical protein
MAKEIATLERIHTWDLVPCPPRVRPTTYKWVYKVKTHSDGFQEQGRDYDENFTPVAHMTTICTLLVVASVRE